MLVIEDREHYEAVVAFAKATGQYEGENNAVLANRLRYLDRYGGKSGGTERIRVRLMPDRAPMSFYFLIERKKADGTWSALFNGGLLYHGPHDGNGNGSAPTFAVTLEPTWGWSIHT